MFTCSLFLAILIFPSYLRHLTKPGFSFSTSILFLPCHFHYLFQLVFGSFGSFLPHLLTGLCIDIIFSLLSVVNIFRFDWVTKTNFLWANNPYKLSQYLYFLFSVFCGSIHICGPWDISKFYHHCLHLIFTFLVMLIYPCFQMFLFKIISLC